MCGLQGGRGFAGDVQALFKGVSDVFGRVDILVNNAGITRDNLMMRMKEDEFDEVLRTNLGAPIFARVLR